MSRANGEAAGGHDEHNASSTKWTVHGSHEYCSPGHPARTQAVRKFYRASQALLMWCREQLLDELEDDGSFDDIQSALRLRCEEFVADIAAWNLLRDAYIGPLVVEAETAVRLKIDGAAASAEVASSSGTKQSSRTGARSNTHVYTSRLLILLIQLVLIAPEHRVERILPTSPCAIPPKTSAVSRTVFRRRATLRAGLTSGKRFSPRLSSCLLPTTAPFYTNTVCRNW